MSHTNRVGKRQHSPEQQACNYFVACTLFSGMTIAAKSSTAPTLRQFPTFLLIPDNYIINTKLSVEKFESVPVEEHFKLDHILAKHRAIQYVEQRTPVTHNNAPAIVIQSGASDYGLLIKVLSERMGQPAWVPMPTAFQPERYDIVFITEIEAPQGTRIGESYIFPQSLTTGGSPKLKITPPGGGVTFPSTITSSAPIQFSFPWPDNNITNRKCMGLAMRALAVIKEEKHINNSYEGVLQKNEKGLFFIRRFDSVDNFVEFRSVWCCGYNVAGRDNNFAGRDNKSGTTMATGFVIDARHIGEPDDLLLEVVLNISKTEVDLTGYALTYTTPSGKLQLELKANEFFGDALDAVDTNTRQASILRAFLGIKQECNNTYVPKEFTKVGLNDDQCGFLSLVLDNVHPIIKLVAPPGTGKSYSIAHAAEELVTFNPPLTIVCTGQTNHCVMNLLEKVSARTQAKALILQSKTAAREFADVLEKFRAFLSVTLCEDLHDLQEGEAKLVDKAKQGKRLTSKARKELLRLNLAKQHPRIVYGTLAMMELNSEALANVDVIFVDEAGMAATTTMVTIIANAPKIRALVIAGDPRQLGIYTADIPTELLKFGFTSIAELQRSDDVMHHLLRMSYRAHPFITECLSAAAYGDEIVPGVKAEERSQVIDRMYTPNHQPIIIINVKSPEKRDPLSYSMTNTEQTRLGAKLLDVLEHKFPELDFKIVCLTLYLLQSEELRNHRKESTRTIIVNTDAYQGQEGNAIVLLTTRSKEQPGEQHAMMRFLNDDRRSVVALSRAKDAVFIIGDVELLRKGVVWRKFIDHASLRSPIVGSDYIETQAELIKKEKLERVQIAQSANIDKANIMETSQNSSAYQQPQIRTPQFPASPVQPFALAGMQHLGGLFAQEHGTSQQITGLPPFHLPPHQQFTSNSAYGTASAGAQMASSFVQFVPPSPLPPPQMSPISPFSPFLLPPPPPPPPQTTQHALLQPPSPPPDVPSSSTSTHSAQRAIGDQLRTLFGRFPHGPSPQPPPRSD